jgi:hypothetical protein
VPPKHHKQPERQAKLLCPGIAVPGAIHDAWNFLLLILTKHGWYKEL